MCARQAGQDRAGQAVAEPGQGGGGVEDQETAAAADGAHEETFLLLETRKKLCHFYLKSSDAGSSQVKNKLLISIFNNLVT